MNIWKTAVKVVAVAAVCIFVAGSAYAENYMNFDQQGTPALTVRFESNEDGLPEAGISGSIYAETNGALFSYGVWGQAEAINKDESVFTIGVVGANSNAFGYGVMGFSTYPTGMTYGVYGSVDSPDGYAVYSEGNTWVNGDIEVTGTIKGDLDLKVTGSINSVESINIAKDATAQASSEYNGNYAASKINDGIYGRWDEGEWASKGEKAGAWIQLDWENPVTFSKVMTHPRPNKYDQIYDAWLQIKRRDGSITDIHLGQFSNGGAPKETHLNKDEGTNVVALKVYITETSPDTYNIGLAEIEAYYDPKLWQ